MNKAKQNTKGYLSCTSSVQFCNTGNSCPGMTSEERCSTKALVQISTLETIHTEPSTKDRSDLCVSLLKARGWEWGRHLELVAEHFREK